MPTTDQIIGYISAAWWTEDAARTDEDYPYNQKIGIKMGKKDNGSISIPFHSKEDYKRILKLLKGDQ